MLTRFTKQSASKYEVDSSPAAEGSSSSPEDAAKDMPLAAANEPEFQPLLDDVPVFAGTRRSFRS